MPTSPRSVCRTGRSRCSRAGFAPISITPAGSALSVISTTWQTVTLMTPQDHDYRLFIVELHARLALAGSRANLIGGLKPGVYAASVAVLALVVVAIAATARRARSAPANGRARCSSPASPRCSGGRSAVLSGATSRSVTRSTRCRGSCCRNGLVPRTQRSALAVRCRAGAVPRADVWDGPGSAKQHCVLHRVQDTAHQCRTTSTEHLA